MRPYKFNIEKNEEVLWFLYIHWIDGKGINHLVGRVSLIISHNGKRFVIEYFEDCLENIIKLNLDFPRISGCDFTEGRRVWEYPYNYLPIFIEERILNPRRTDLEFHLNRYGLKIYDRYEFLKRSHGVCGDNFLFVSDKEDETNYWHKFKHGCCLNVPNPNKEDIEE